ncbi:MAG: hypothetical protein R3A47_07245 [Polyangiales bacterium]
MDWLIALSLIATGSAIFVYRYPNDQKRLFALALAAHLVAAWLQIEVTLGYYDGGDQFGYHQVGLKVARALDDDFSRWAGTFVSYTLGKFVLLPFPTAMLGNTTASTVGLCGWLMWVFRIESMFSLSIMLAFFATCGQFLIYRFFIDRLPNVPRGHLAFCSLFVPSTTYWASGATKESFVVLALGLIIAGLDAIDKQDYSFRGISALVVGATLASITKPYFLFPLAISAAVFIYANTTIRAKGRFEIRGRAFVTAVAVGILAVVGLGRLFPRFAYEQVAQNMAQLQQYAGQGGSGYVIGDPGAKSLVAQAAFAPLALFYSLFRPTVFEVYSATTAASALETTFCTVLLLQVFWRFGFASTAKRIINDPVLLSFFAFIVLCGVSIGLSTTNLGTLSRYRAPMMPFYFALLVTLRRADEGVRKERGAFRFEGHVW